MEQQIIIGNKAIRVDVNSDITTEELTKIANQIISQTILMPDIQIYDTKRQIAVAYMPEILKQSGNNHDNSEVKNMFINDITINVTGIETVEQIEEKIKEAIYNLTGTPMIRPEDNYSIAIKALREIAQCESEPAEYRVKASELLLQHS